ncbi:MAG TPA: neutral/alkaline non-lysosomal ceramidase N-terminal domain-containing protein [Kofleriaceae bacterium]|nr:neutral/alkaline non-lysosomal ceramidase N-terminal domain-containing protein [Kofleriaceae bacterium]
MRGSGLALVCIGLFACGGDDDSPPTTGVTTDLCTYQPLTPTAHAGGTVTAAPLQAGAAERILNIPVGTALGGYTGRAGFISSAGAVDARKIALSGTFNPSIGVTSAPKVKALALTAGDETVVILKADIIFTYEGMVFDVEQRLGAEFAGKVMIATSHSHSGWAQFTAHGPLKLGAGQMRDVVYQRFIDDFEAAARDALAARQPAKLGVFATSTFDMDDVINRDRRGENDELPGGTNKGDEHLFLLRVDSTAGAPIAVVPIFGEHGTLNDEDNPFASTDAPGAIERALEEQFDSKVVVMHLQSAGADTSPSGHGGVDCNAKPGRASDPCFTWANEEGHGRGAIPELMAAYTQAGTAMRDTLELEMVTRSIETGPFASTFSIRGGALTYAPFDPSREPDGVVFDGSELASPIDEFNAPVGAGLCQDPEPMFPAAAIPGTEGIKPYGSCLRLDLAGEILEPIFDIDFGVSDKSPVCESTRTTISALRLGDYVIGTLPGEVSVLLADLVRSKSAAGADKTIVVGYSQGHVGYMLRPEDWVLGGYEPSVTFWGPLEAEYIAERLLDLLPLAQTPAREDTASDGQSRVAVPTVTDNLEKDDPAPMAGTVPSTIPDVTWARTGTPTQAQPAAQIPRIAGIATFVWFGDDPLVKTPHVTLEVETSPGTFAPVLRRSGRVVEDAEIVLAYTPSPLQRSGLQTHVWVAEWQAVPWLGAKTTDSLDDRGGLPLGKYRFHVEGNGWTLDSNPFQVTQGGLVVGAVQRAGGTIRATASWHAPKGWRLMDMNLMSNQPVPVRGQQVTVALLGAGGASLGSTQVTTDGNGAVQVPDNASATQVKITDRFGNVSTAPIP